MHPDKFEGLMQKDGKRPGDFATTNSRVLRPMAPPNGFFSFSAVAARGEIPVCVCACVSVLVQNKFLLPRIIQHKKSLKDDLNPFHATATVPMAHNPEVRYTAHHGLRRSFYTFRLSKDLEPRFVKT